MAVKDVYDWALKEKLGNFVVDRRTDSTGASCISIVFESRRDFYPPTVFERVPGGMAYRLLFVPLVKEAFFKAFPNEEPLKFGSTLPAYLGSAVLGALPAESAKAVGSIVNGYSDSLRALVTASVQTVVVGGVALEVKVVEGPDGLVRASEGFGGVAKVGGDSLEVFVGKGA